MSDYDHRHFSTARNQLYDLKVAVWDIAREKMPKRATPEAEHLMHVLQSVVDEACEAFMAGDILAVDIHRYTPLALPGFEEYVEEMKDPMHRSGISSSLKGDDDI